MVIGSKTVEGVGNASIERDNAQCLVAYEALLDAFRRCESHAAPYLNVTAIFFHDLMRILTGYILLWNELQGPYAPPADMLPPALTSFPYTSYRDLLDGIALDRKDFRVAMDRHGIRWKLSEYKRTMLSTGDMIRAGHLFRGAKRIWVKGPGVCPKLLSRGFTAAGLWADYRTLTRIPIPDRDAQLNELQMCVLKLWDMLELPGDPRTPAELVRQHVFARSSDGLPGPFRYDVVLSGTLLALEYRFMAALARYHQVPVVSVSHGDGIESAHDEPVFGYGERTYPNVFIGYGEAGRHVPDNAQYRRPLYDAPRYVCSDSNFIRAQHTGAPIKTLGNLEGKTFMYVPSQFYGQQRYGPFHVWADQAYFRWQEALFEAFPNLILKRHPKERCHPALASRNTGRVLTGWLENCLDQADVFVFDIISGASCIAMATDKPVVYFHIGLRNFTEHGAAAIRERCVWVDVDPAHPSGLREQLEARAHEPKTNAFVRAFCLRGDYESAQLREETVLDEVSSVIRKMPRATTLERRS